MKVREKCIELRSVVKKWGLKKNQTKKYSCWLRKIKMSGKSYPEFQWTDNEIQLLMEASQNVKKKLKKITRRLQDYIPDQL